MSAMSMKAGNQQIRVVNVAPFRFYLNGRQATNVSN